MTDNAAPAAPPDRDGLPYRDCVGIALFNRKGKVFIARRILTPGPDTTEVDRPWQLPQGGIDRGEAPLDAAHRELFEETGIVSIRLIGEIGHWIDYDLPDAVLGIALGGRYRGQRQKWFAFLFEGEEAEIDLERKDEADCDPEFDAWRWEDLAALPEIIVPFKRPAYLEIVAGFAAIPGRLRDGLLP